MTRTSRFLLASGVLPADGPSDGAVLSADGRFVAFASSARDLIPGENGGAVGSDVYRRDRQTGAIVRVSAGIDGGKGNGQSFAPAMSADGRFVAFASLATNLVSSDLGGQMDVFLRDLQLNSTIRVSAGIGGIEPTGASARPSISADGHHVVFESTAANLVSAPAPEGSSWCYLRDILAASTTRVVSVSFESELELGAVSPALSADGHWIAFSSSLPDLIESDTNAVEDVFLRGPLP